MASSYGGTALSADFLNKLQSYRNQRKALTGRDMSPQELQALIQAQLNVAESYGERAATREQAKSQWEQGFALQKEQFAAGQSQFAQNLELQKQAIKKQDKTALISGIGQIATGAIGAIPLISKAGSALGLWGGGALPAISKMSVAPGLASGAISGGGGAAISGMGAGGAAITGEAAGAFGGTVAGTGASGGTAGGIGLSGLAAPLGLLAAVPAFIGLMGGFGPDPDQNLGTIPAQRIENIPQYMQYMSQDDIFSLARDLREPNRGAYIPSGMTRGGSGPITNAEAYYYRPEYKQAVDQIMAQNYGADWENKARPVWEFQDRLAQYNQIYLNPANYSDQNLGRTEMIKAIKNDPYQGPLKDNILRDLGIDLASSYTYNSFFGGP